MPRPNPETDLSKEQMLLWHRILPKGLDRAAVPKDYGGPGWSITRRFIFEQETTRRRHAAAAGFA